MYVVDKELAERLERSEAAHWASLAAGLPATYGAEVRRFGPLTALACPGMKERSFVNRIIGVQEGAGADLAAAVEWLAGLGVPVRVDLCAVLAGEETLKSLQGMGFTLGGFQVALFSEARWVARPGSRRVLPAGVEIREAESQADRSFITRAMPVAFDATAEPWLAWLTHSMEASYAQPGWRTYLALVNGEPAGFGQLHIADGVGSLALAGTLPAFRGRGVQSALIQRRIDDAAAAGCDLIASQTGNGTVSQWNMERTGMRIAYTKAELYRR